MSRPIKLLTAARTPSRRGFAQRARAKALCLCGIVLAVTTGPACNDSLLDSKIEALGPEQKGFRASSVHRPGSPCVLCHSAYYGAEPRLSVGGTVFVIPDEGDPFPISDVTIRLVDSEGVQHDMVSNRCGNFFVTKKEFNPVYPMRTELLAPDPNDPEKLLSNRPMASRISRDGSCGTCHKHPRSPFSPGVVFVVPPQGSQPEPPDRCPDPNYAEQPFD